MGIGNLLKTLMALYLSIWLLILKKLKVVYQLDGNNFGIFVSFVGYFRRRRDEKPKRTVSLPSIHRSTSIRERRRFHSDGGGLTNRYTTNMINEQHCYLYSVE